MLGLLERQIVSIKERLVMVAPTRASVPGVFGRRKECADLHRSMLGDMQSLRGRVYLQDGAITPKQLTHDGRHETPEDGRSWHLLMLDKEQKSVTGCIWYMAHETSSSIQDLRMRNCALARRDDWRDKLSDAVSSEIEQARKEQVHYAEVGGWALSKETRCTPDGVLLILATFGLSRVLGGALGVATATARHSSATILQRLGLSRLVVDGSALEPYFDDHYGCDMELLRFDTRRSEPRYDSLIERLKSQLAEVAVVSAPAAREATGTRRAVAA